LYGGGGGGGGWRSGTGVTAGGSGAQGIIVITYTAVAPQPRRLLLFEGSTVKFFNGRIIINQI
jgi:hypothetical protein